nr:carboxymuconolactone decarboxylase family protein [Acinetobacter sp. Marseille-Q1620]
MPTSNIDPKSNLPGVIQNLYQVHASLDTLALLESKLTHLILLRVSQINACAFCVKMHLAEARADGETQERLDRLVVWRHSADFTDQEKAAFEWAESLTTLQDKTDYAILRQNLLRHFNEQQISALTVLISMINLWNRIQISQY